MQNNDDGHKKLMTIGQASEYLGVSVDTLRRWEKKGRIEAYRSPGGHRHYDTKDLDKLFNKRYTRDEPTIRTSKKEVEKLPESKKEEEQKNKEEKPLSEEYPKISLPAWRAIETDIEELQLETLELIQEKVLERPVRELKIPENTRVQITQVTKEETVISSNDSYIQQQTVSILTPPSQDGKPKTPQVKIGTGNKLKAINPSQNNKALFIYLSVMASVVLFGIAWYFLWKNSQTVLSPIP
jgi:excisionase family DNA binding protein